ncbi:non-ribosomal peptide synthetase [Nocardia arizonensis]|uniref:non-ribosomal peptide synthetase n=1 Tax=Nocardia arizonensis TaxID=1141647 RepID=UPI0006CF2940|nr:non-ribosomal peptide synthetase [Nocardia arizonensis]
METARRSGRSSRRRRAGSPTFGQLLTAAVESAADSIAVRGVDAALTYRQLDADSSRLARELIERGVGPGDVVAIGIARSVESVIAVWGVAKTGAAFVPVDPAYPADRIAHILTDSGAVIGLTIAPYRAVLGTAVYWIELSDPVVANRIADRPEHPISYTDRVRPLDERHPAYVIYTSGSTGKPKGVVVTHTGLAGLVAAEREHYGVDERSRVLHVCSPNFDVSVLELLLAFTAGATLVVAPPGVFGGYELADLLRRERVTHMLITPGALESVDSADLPDLRVVVVAGDKFGPELVGRWADGVREFYNGYGPTEATILATSSAPMRGDEPVTIGTAIPGVGAFVLDPRLRPVPAGVIGELYLSGPALAQGYLGRPGLSAERFVASPFGADTGNPGARLYRTGDLVRRAEEGGAIEYLGRVDFQVKVRGFRIELGEIDNALTAHPAIDYAATLGRTLPSGQTALVSYVLPHGHATVDTAELTAYLAQSLPAYMIPAAIVVLDEIPLNAVGKLDRAALPEPVFAAREFREPATATERTVADVFAAVLLGDATPVGADDDFFELGGNSLLAAQAAARIGSALDVRVPVQLLFEASTVAALAERVEQQAGTPAGRALHAVERPARIPLSYAQQRMWFLNRFDPDSAVNNIPMAVRLTGRLDVAALRAAVADLVERHEVLRTRYPEVDGQGVQRILAVGEPGATPDLPVVDAVEERVPELIGAAVLTGFDVTAAPPIRLRLLRLGATEHVLVCVVHHIAGDGFSTGPLTRDLMTAYVGRAAGSAPDWAALEVQYADYAIWQRTTLGSEDDPDSLLGRQISYWQRELAGLPEQLNLPAERPRPTVASYRGDTFRATVSPQLHEALRNVAARHNSTLFMVVHAALAVLLSRLSGTRDIAIGTPIAGRGEAALDDLIGMFVNTLVLRTEVDPGIGFAELLGRVRASDVDAFGHADVPFERLVELLDPVRSTARHPLFQVLLVLQNLTPTTLELPELTVAPVEMSVPLAKFDLQLEVVEQIAADGSAHGLSLAYTYATDLFDEATIRDLADRFALVLSAAAADPAAVVGDIDLLAAGERELVLREWNTRGAVIPEVTLVDLIAVQARRRPDAVAIRFGDTTLTFAELQRKANSVARALIARGAGPERLVAVAVGRTEELPVALLGVLLSGAGYLPIDTAYPVQRLEFMLTDAAPACVLTTDAERDAIPNTGAPVVLLEETPAFASAPITDADRVAPLRPDNLAYVIYTSGSTGVPKGVGVAHRNVVELFANTQLLFEFDETDVWTLFHSFAFDFSVWELWCALANGGAVVVVDYLTSRSPELFRDLLIREQVTVLNQTPSAFYQLAEADRAAHATGPGKFALRYIVFGGEALDPRRLRRWYERHPVDAPWLVNMYGITETTVHVSFLSLDEQMVDIPASVIGRALPGLDAYVVDPRLHPAPVGVAGEITVAGRQLSRGYLGRPGLTATRFVANPFGAPGSRMYRTGDVGRWVGLGGTANLEYAGRSDQQVQVRGFRIELGEIEAALLNCPGVSQAVVVVDTDEQAGDRLIGYAVPDRGAGGLDPVELRTEVARFLTGYMVPDAVVVIDALPLTPNGKLDRKALPAAEFVSAAAFRAPSSPIEQAVAEVYAELLGVAEVGLDDDFFALGGNSLLATRAVARVNAALDAGVAVRELFEAPTVAELAARVQAGAGRGRVRVPLTRVQRPERVPLSLAQQRMWVLNRLDPASPAYNIPLAIRLTGALDVSALRYAVADVLERHEALRTRYPAADGVPYQDVVSVAEALPGGLEVEVTDDPIARVTELLSGGFDVTAKVPLRAALLAAGADAVHHAEDHLLVVVVHHIAADGVSMAPLARDLATAYVARVEGRSPAWAPLDVQYADFALWQRAEIGEDTDENSVAARQLAFWRDELAGLSGELALPLDRPRPAVPSMRGATTAIILPAATHDQLAALARAHNSTLFMVVHAALAVLLARMSGSADIAIGTAVAGRGERALDDLVGMFVNTLTLRTRVDSGASFAELVELARETDLSAFGNADVPFERVVEEVAAGRGGHNPLFQVVLSFESTEQPSLELPGLTIHGLDAGTVAAKFDLQVLVDPRRDADGTAGELSVVFSYATDIFDESTARSFARRFERIVTAVVGDPAVIVGDIDILDAEERDRALTGSGAPDSGETGGAGAALGQALTAAVEDDPQGPAVVWGEEAVSYRDLDARSSRLARVLIEDGRGPGDGIAVRLDRGVDAVVAHWAVLKAGAAIAVPPARAALTITRGGAPETGRLSLDDPTVAARLDAQSPRPVTYANRVRTLRGGDPVLIGPGGTVTYDELATAAERLARHEVSFESRTFGVERTDSVAALLETVVAGVNGASIVVGSAGADPTGFLADEWVTHFVTDAYSAAGVRVAELEDLKVVVFDGDPAAAPGLDGAVEVVTLSDLFGR